MRVVGPQAQAPIDPKVYFADVVRTDPHHPTLAVRRAALASVGVAVAFEALLLAASWVPALHDAGAWTDAVWAGPLGLAAVAVAALAAPTWLRATVHGGPVPAPPHAVRAILAGSAGTLTAVSLAVAGCVLAMLVRAGDVVWDVTALALLAALVGVGGLVAMAARLDGQARDAWRKRLATVDADAARPDVLDDAATLAARWWPGSVPARLSAWVVRGLDVWSWSPRRHLTTFVGTAAATAGVAWTFWDAARGPGTSAVPAVVSATLVAGLVAAALAAAIAWLGLLRPVPVRTVTSGSRAAR